MEKFCACSIRPRAVNGLTAVFLIFLDMICVIKARKYE